MNRHLPTTVQFRNLSYAVLGAFFLLTFLGVDHVSAQQSTPVLRAARLPESARDTGDAFKEMEHMKAANTYWRLRTTSGDDNEWMRVEQEGYKAFTSMRNSIAFKAEGQPAWQQLGSGLEGHASGRIRDIAFDPNDPNIAYVAAAQGGVWKTTNLNSANTTWTSLSGSFPTNAMGAIAVDPNNGQVLYAGTGEVAGGDGFNAPPGAGLYKSIDGGLNWTRIATTAQVGSTCGKILVDPSNSQHVFVATGNGAHLQVSKDGGATWAAASGVSGDAWSIAMDPTDPQKIYVGCISGGIFRSADNGNTWTKCTVPTGGTGSANCTAIAIAPSSPNVIYAGIANGFRSSGSSTYGIIVSNDYGATWRLKNKCNDNNQQQDGENPADAAKYPHSNYMNFQGVFDNAIAVNPSNASQIFVGGISVWTSSDSGTTLIHCGYWTAAQTSTYYVHADVHELTFHNGSLVACTDGGLGIANSTGTIWNTTMNDGLPTFQFVGADADAAFTYALAGAQDNGVCKTSISNGTKSFAFSRSGDAGILWISTSAPLVCYSTYVYADFEKSNDGGASWLPGPNNNRNLITNTTLLSEGAQFYPNWDVFEDGTYVVFAGSRHLFVSTNGGDDGFQYTSATSNIGAQSVAISQADPNVGWAGNGSATVYLSSDVIGNASHWKGYKITGGSGVVTGIASDPNDPLVDHVWAVTSGGSHFFSSVDSGKTWTASTTFPNVACQSIARSPVDGTLYVGTDFGVVYSNDNGANWAQLGLGMPTVQVTSLKVKVNPTTQKQYLLAATYGRGLYYVEIPPPAAVSQSAQPSVAQLDATYPNPVSLSSNANATFGFSLEKDGLATLTLHDELGREVLTAANQHFTAGHHTVKINLGNLPTGTYITALTTSGRTITNKLTLIK